MTIRCLQNIVASFYHVVVLRNIPDRSTQISTKNDVERGRGFSIVYNNSVFKICSIVS